MKRIVAGLFLAASISSAFAQSGASVRQSGNITPNQVPWWVTAGVIGGGVSSADSPVTSFGVSNNGGCGISVASDRITAAGRNLLCFGASTSGAAVISLQNYGTAVPQTLDFIINGTTYSFPFAVGGIVGPGSTTVGDIVLWNNTTGTLVKDAGIGITGIDANVVNTQTTNYTILNTDCGKTIQAGTGSTGQFALTLPSVSGFPANCSVSIKNGDTARGKILSGFPADFSPGGQSVLWPSASGSVKIVNGAWATGVNPGIWNSAIPVILNINHSIGSDTSNDCLGTGTGACATIYHAFQLLQTTIKGPTASVPVIQSDCGFTETPPGNFLGPTASGPGGVVAIVGNNSNPAACSWTSAGWGADDGAVISLQGFRSVNASTSQTWLTVGKLGLVAFLNMVWGPATPTFSAHVQLTGSGANFVWDGGTYQIGDATCAPTCMKFHIINSGGAVALQHPTVSVPNALTFDTFYVGTGSGSQANITTAFTGAGSGAGSTGSQYNIGNNATLALSPTTGIPGATAGGANSGGAVDSVSASITSTQLPNPAIFSGQFYSTFGTPTIANAACGAGANGTVSGTNQSGTVTIGAAATTTCTVSFSTTLSAAPNACVIFPGSGGAADQATTLARVGAPSATTWVITGSALASTTYRYICL